MAAAPPEAEFRTRFPRQLVDGQPVLVCTRVQNPPKIDGEVDRDGVWSSCGRTQGAWVEMGTKNVSARQTVVYACYDDRAIYLGFICEESELSSLRMDGNVQSLQAGQAGPDDSVEAVFEIGGLQGDGATHAFRANSRARLATMGFSNPYNWAAPAWESVGKFGPNRWMVEMAVPFGSLKSPQFPRGVGAPVRGDIWGIKLARYGGQLKSSEPRMTSTFNVEIPYPLLYICGYNGLLYFEDSNLLRDGGFALPADKSPWKAAGQVTRVEGGVTLDAGASLTQQAAVRPSSFYLLRLEADGKPEVLVDGRRIDPGDGAGAGFWTARDQTSLELAVRAAAAVTLRSVDVRYQPGEEPPGIWCLTNNYRSGDRNIRALDPAAPEGSYRYVVIDYTGRVTGEDHPSRVQRGWAHDPTRAVLDVGGTEGWIPFGKGSLTGKPFPVFWQTVNPEDTAGWGRHEHATIDIDLRREYFVRGLDVLWPAPFTQNLEVWGKPEGAEQWTYLYTGDGPFVEPAKRRSDPRGCISLRGLDSVVRYVRWRSTERHPSYPQMDGIQEFWVWGEPKGARASTAIKPFQPWVSQEQVPPVRPRTWTADRESAQIVPRPRSLEKRDGRFVVDANTRLLAQDNPAALRAAAQVRDEIRERWTLDLRVVREEEVSPRGSAREAQDVSSNVIYFGQPRLGEGARKVAAAEGLEVDEGACGPQGYALAVAPSRIVVLGCDDDGLYWGVQSLMMAMRWRIAGEGETSGPSVPALRAVDRPGTPERALYMHKGYSAILNVPQSEIGRVKKLFHLLSRFKFNVVYVNAGHGDGGTWPYAGYSWTKGTLAKLCREIRDEYHVEIRPIMPPSEGMSRDWWKDIIEGANDWSMGESDPDELAPELGGHVNICPLHPRTLPLVLDKIDRTLEDYGYPSTVWLWDQAYISPTGGGRWAQCRRCQKSGKTPDEIYVWFVSRIVEHLEARQTKARFKSGWLRIGERGEKERRKVAVEASDLPATLRIDLDSLPSLSSEAGEEYLRKTLDPKRTANGPPGWPSVERVMRGPWVETEVLHSLTGGGLTWGGGGTTVDAPPAGNLADICEALWYAPDNRPGGGIDIADLCVWVHAWWFGWEFPAWRNGTPPNYHPLDLRPFVNHVSQATGVETLQPGHPPELDLRYLAPGKQMLGGVQFDMIDAAQNGGKGVLMLGRPPEGIPRDVAASIVERAGPIPVGRKLASLAFLRARWQCSLGGWSWHGQWLRPTCRVVYDDGSWLVVDSFSFPHEGHATSNWNDGRAGDLYYRMGWVGNTPTGRVASLVVVDWVNPYPSKVIRELDFFTPDMEDAFGKRVNNMAEAIVAISGVEPTEHDLAFWSDRTGRPPLLPALEPRRTDVVELKRAGNVEASPQDGSWRNRFVVPKGDIAYAGRLIGFDAKKKGSTAFSACGRFEGARLEGFDTFGATLTFDAPTRIARVELIGPTHDWGSLGSYSVRRQKVDATVEISRDGKDWEKAGELRGISAQADFLPVELPPDGIGIKAIRLTATAAPYHEYYHPTNYWGGMFNRPGSTPHFAWRLFAPADRTVP